MRAFFEDGAFGWEDPFSGTAFIARAEKDGAIQIAEHESGEWVARIRARDVEHFAKWLANAGVPELTTAKLMGHASSAMVRRVYAQLAPQTLEDAVARLPGEEVTT